MSHKSYAVIIQHATSWYTHGVGTSDTFELLAYATLSCSRGKITIEKNVSIIGTRKK